MNKIIQQALSEGRKHLSENEVKQVLKDFEIPTTDFQYFHDLSEVDFDKLKFPVALKICSPNILHKTDVGGVVLNIQKREELTKHADQMKNKFPGEGLLVEPMYKGLVEVIIGLINDATFGLTIMFGIGGIYTEVYKDVTFRVIPIQRTDAEEMLTELRASPILEGARKIKIDKEKLVQMILKTSEFANANSKIIDQMDLNPVFLTEDSVRAVDAKLILR
ncbi:MAG: acetate--CoA ligase family protein [Thermoplasmata archaeon]|nr:acetate--CoA ligase family protein [Thermoplasmata archaeon]